MKPRESTYPQSHTLPDSGVTQGGSALLNGVSEVLRERIALSAEAENLHLLSYQALQDRIHFYDIQMQAAMKLAMKGEAHRCRQHFEAALRERNSRPHLVAAREKDLGLL